ARASGSRPAASRAARRRESAVRGCVCARPRRRRSRAHSAGRWRMTPLATLVRAPIDSGALIRSVSSPANGAVILFLGAVRQVNEGRDVTGMDYAAYETMALRELQAIVDEGAARFGTADVVVEHR